MNLKDLIFGGGVKSGGDGGTYRDSIQAWLPIKNIIGGVVITKDGRFVKILELLPVNIYLKSPNDRQNIISSFAAYLKIAPNDLQMVARTLPADTQAYVEQMQRYAEKEDNEACREMIEDNIQEIGNGIASDAMRHRFFLVFQYEASMRAKRNTVDSIIQRLNEEADTARRYLDVCELEVLEPRYSDNFVLKLLYEILSKKTSQRVRLPDGVFDMTTAVVCYGKRTVDPRYLEAIDVMLELSGCDPSFFSSERLESPFLLRFTGSGEELSYLFTVVWMDTPERIHAKSRMKGERIIWISDRRDSRGIALPRHHIFAVRQEDGTHRFFGSHEPEKI